VEHVEVPIQTPYAVPSLVAVAGAAKERGKAVGAGTVTTVDQLDAAADAASSFTVSPGLDPHIVRESIIRGIPHVPGVATASDILRARLLGLTWLKAFPASVLGPQWISAMRGPFPEVSFIATGGMTADNSRQYFDAGVSVVGLSSAFASADKATVVRDLIAASRKDASS
jgi:Entner-Doudoroff aldolase